MRERLTSRGVDLLMNGAERKVINVKDVEGFFIQKVSEELSA